MKQIKTQKQLDALCKKGVSRDEEVEIIGQGLRLNSNLEVFGFLKVSVAVDMNWSSHVEAWGYSRVEAWGSVSVQLFSMKVELHLFGWAVAFKHFKEEGNITKTKGTTVIQVPEMEETFEAYEGCYPVVKNGKKLLFYKAVHKKDDGSFTADYNKQFTYEVGKTYKHENHPASAGCCAVGLHIAHLSWARSFGVNWDDLAILECEVAKKDIIVPKDTDGKIRCSKLKVVREVPESEWYG